MTRTKREQRKGASRRTVCTIGGCERPECAKGLCAMHYNHKLRTGHPFIRCICKPQFKIGATVFCCKTGSYLTIGRISECGGYEYARSHGPNHWFPEDSLVPSEEAHGREKLLKNSYRQERKRADR